MALLNKRTIQKPNLNSKTITTKKQNQTKIHGSVVAFASSLSKSFPLTTLVDEERRTENETNKKDMHAMTIWLAKVAVKITTVLSGIKIPIMLHDLLQQNQQHIRHFILCGEQVSARKKVPLATTNGHTHLHYVSSTYK